MHTVEVVELTGAGVVILLLGLVVVSRDWWQNTLRSFLVFCLAISLWSWGVALFIHTGNLAHALGYANFYYESAFAIAVVSQVFVSFWLHNRPKVFAIFTVLPVILLIALAGVLIAWPNFIVNSVYFAGEYKAVNFNAPGYGLFSLLFIVVFAVSVVRLIIGSYALKGVRRLQARYIAAGLICSGVFGACFNLVLPWFGNYRLIWVGPLSAVIFVAFVGYAIARQKLFDIRLVVARTVGYGLSVALAATIYGFIVFSLANYVFKLGIPVSAQIWLSAATGFVGLVFPFFRRRFERLTNQIFYRDAYDVQELYDELNKTLVTSLGMDELLTDSMAIIEASLKPEFVCVGLRDGVTGQRIFGTSKDRFSSRDIARARSITTHIRQKVILADTLDEAHSNQAALKDLMVRNNLAILVRLTQDVRSAEEGLGYLMLGPRKSGNAYSAQDVDVLDTIANELVIAIQNALHVEEIQRFNVTLQQKVDEATRHLRSSNRRLTLLDETKDEFITMASHQLRTPLTSVKGYLSMVLEGDAGKLNENQKKLLNQSYISAQRMVYLIADLLNLSRLGTGKFVIEETPVDLSEVVQAEIEQLQETASSRGITLNYQRPEHFSRLMLDETKIHQVVMNFIDNAIYYTPEGGTINVSLHETPTAVEYLVQDTGIGVPKHEQHRLFNKFYRAANARKARPDGTGLGLFMAKKVVAAQGGVIIFSSEEGKGSTFGFRFSKAQHLVPVVSEVAPAKASL